LALIGEGEADKSYCLRSPFLGLHFPGYCCCCIAAVVAAVVVVVVVAAFPSQGAQPNLQLWKRIWELKVCGLRE